MFACRTEYIWPIFLQFLRRGTQASANDQEVQKGLSALNVVNCFEQFVDTSPVELSVSNCYLRITAWMWKMMLTFLTTRGVYMQ